MLRVACGCSAAGVRVDIRTPPAAALPPGSGTASLYLSTVETAVAGAVSPPEFLASTCALMLDAILLTRALTNKLSEASPLPSQWYCREHGPCMRVAPHILVLQ
jgi:hypothetical protein